jgi:hypothetical protein
MPHCVMTQKTDNYIFHRENLKSEPCQSVPQPSSTIWWNIRGIGPYLLVFGMTSLNTIFRLNASLVHNAHFGLHLTWYPNNKIGDTSKTSAGGGIKSKVILYFVITMMNKCCDFIHWVKWQTEVTCIEYDIYNLESWMHTYSLWNAVGGQHYW